MVGTSPAFGFFAWLGRALACSQSGEGMFALSAWQTQMLSVVAGIRLCFPLPPGLVAQ